MDAFMHVLFNINKFVLNPIIALGFAVAVLLLMWGGLMSILAQQNGDLAEATRYRKHLMWGLLGMFIMASVFGILEIMMNALRFIGKA